MDICLLRPEPHSHVILPDILEAQAKKFSKDVHAENLLPLWIGN
jgi:hypothetical protein